MPKRQIRGKQRMESLLQAAEAVFAEVGFERATTNLIAARAEVSPGTLYQFFSNKDSMAEVLAMQYADRLQALHERLFPAPLAVQPLMCLIDTVVDPFLDFHDHAPAFEALFVGAAISTDLALRVQTLKDGIVDRLFALFMARCPRASKEDLRWAAEICVAAFRGVLPVITATKGAKRTRAISELKLLFLRYLDPVVG